MAMLTSDRELIFAPYHQASYNASLSLPINTKHRTRRSRRRRTHTTRPTGVWNAGQSCHLGATLTVLSSIPCFRDWVSKNLTNNDTLTTVLRHYLLNATYPENGLSPLDPRPILRVLEASGWHSRNAQDAFETMQRIFELLNIDAWSPTTPCDGVASCLPRDETAFAFGRTGKLGLLVDHRRNKQTESPFHIISSLAHVCHGCHRQSDMRFQSTPIVSLPVADKPTSVSSLLTKTLLNKEVVKMSCDSCDGETLHTLLPDVCRWPAVLILHLQKAVFGSSGVTVASGNVIVTEIIQCISGKGSGETLVFYQLRSVIRHSGLASGYRAHFDSVVSTSTTEPWTGLKGIGTKKTWWHVNDDRVVETSLVQACDSRTAYILVYDRVR